MDLLKTAKNETAYLKAGIQGFAGSGKTFTAAKIAIGLHKYIDSKKPIAFADTETGSDFVLPLFQAENIELVVCKSRAFIDLLKVIDEAEKNCSVLIIDSITHFWSELLNAYQKKKNVNRLTIRDWMPIKTEWRSFTDAYIMSNLHIIMLGRAGWDFGYIENEHGEKELTKTDTKMKVESETGFEPNILIEMEKVKVERQKIGAGFVHRAWILKDRADAINGKYFDNPDFDCFLPHIEKLNLGGKHKVLDTTKTSEEIFTTERSMAEYYKQRDIALEEMKDEITLRYPGRDVETGKEKVKLLKNIFGTSSWTAISNMKLEDVKIGLEKVKAMKIIEKEDKTNGNRKNTNN